MKVMTRVSQTWRPLVKRPALVMAALALLLALLLSGGRAGNLYPDRT